MMKKIINLLKERLPFLVFVYASLIDWLRSTEKMQITPMGFKFMGNKSMSLGSFEPGETNAFLTHLPSADVVINIGANVGYYCCIALSHKKYVVAFEPMVNNVRALMRNVRENGWDSNFEIFPLAVSNKIGVVEIYGSGTGASLVKGWAGASDRYSNFVPCSTLDTVLGHRFDGKRCLIMVDIEGAERSMLEGASVLLDMYPQPVWLVEISIQSHQPKKRKLNPDLLPVFQTFWSRGYEAWTTHWEQRHVPRSEVEAIIAGGPDTLWGDTFLFLPSSSKNSVKVALE